MIPSKCPSCNFDLVWDENNVDLLCLNIKCPAQILNKIAYFLRTLGVEEISETTLEKFNLQNIQDVYTKLTYDYIISLDGFQKRKTEIILQQLNKSIHDVHPAKLLAAFGIDGLGIKNAKKIYDFINKTDGQEFFQEFFKLNKEDFLFINGIGTKNSDKIINQRKNIYDILEFLYDIGLTFSNEDKIHGIFTDMRFTLTGASPTGDKKNIIEKLIIDNGGEHINISKNTTYLVAENINGSSTKLKKARQLNIKIISYEDFYKMLNK